MEWNTVYSHIGTQARGNVARMVQALSLHSWNNTPAEGARLAAGVYALRHWRAYQWYCHARRDARARRTLREVA